MKFLYAERESKTTQNVSNILRYHGHTVDTVCDGDAALSFALAENYDCIIAEDDIPKVRGSEILSKIRQSGIQTPILLISDEIVHWTECTANTRYLCKPFAFGEFLAHLRTLCPSKKDIFPSSLCFGDIMLNINTSTLAGKEISLTLPRIECRMMEFLIFNKGTYVSTSELLSSVWGENTPTEIGIVWVYISYLRKKLDSISTKVKIKAKRNIGYILEIV